MEKLIKRRATSGMDWNTMLGLTAQLKKDNLDRDLLLILCGSYFGLRIGDLLSLTWNQVLEKEKFTILEGKTKKERTVTINDAVAKALNHVYKKTRCQLNDYIFANRWSGKITVSYINKRLKVIFDKYNVKVQNPSSHTLRKTFGKRVYEMDGKSDAALIYLSQIFSHSCTAVTRQYIGITDEKIADVYLNL